MGAKQSKRSVDISGKEAESAGEVAAAGAGGEGRVEQLADADALKPQINGDAHIQEQTEKEKELDSGIPENEKDATTEKEEKQDEEKEAAPLTNGTENDQKVENGESTPTPEDGKKPKKEKVKKKWSLRSISFSRKDKPKQEKKQKDEEPKTNGEPEKVPEETAEVAPESAVTSTASDSKTETEEKEEKTPETPVTEPITNGSTTPESPKVDSPVVEEPVAPSPEPVRSEPQPEIQPDQLPVNGLSLEETAKETPANENIEESKEEIAAVTAEIVPPEISVKKEVCVEQMPLIDSTPPPLPANPPPSSVASFAATTMAPESTDASLANTADNAISPPPVEPISKDKLVELPPNTENEITHIQSLSNTSPLKQVNEETPVVLTQTEAESKLKEVILNAGPHVHDDLSAKVNNIKIESEITEGLVTHKVNNKIEIEDISETVMPAPQTEVDSPEKKIDIPNITDDLPSPPSPICGDVNSTEKNSEKDTEVTHHETKDIVVNSNHVPNVEENSDVINDNENPELNVKTKSKDSLGNLIETIECNGNMEENLATEKELTELIPPISTKVILNMESGKTATTPDDSMPPSLSEANESAPAAGATSNDESESFPAPPSDLCRSDSASPDVPDAPPTQDPISVSDKLAELIPEIPEVPEIKTETLQETTSDVAVAN